MRTFGFNADDADRIAQTVRYVETHPTTGVPRDDPRPVSRRRVQVVLVTRLDGTTDVDSPTNCRATVKTGLSGDEALGTESLGITVHNRTAMTYAGGMLLHAVECDEDDKWYVVETTSQRRRCILCTDLPAARDVLADPGTATAYLLAVDDFGILVKFRNADDELQTITVTNYFEHISIKAGTYVKVEFQEGVWEPYAADCDAFSSDSSDWDCEESS
jgi:hypothetical protein